MLCFSNSYVLIHVWFMQGHFLFVAPTKDGIKVSLDALVSTVMSRGEWQGVFMEPFISTADSESTYVEFQLGFHTNIHIGVTTLTVEPDDWTDILLSKCMKTFDCGLLGSGANVGLHIFHGNLFIYINGSIFDSKDPIICNLPAKFRFVVKMFDLGASIRVVTSAAGGEGRDSKFQQGELGAVGRRVLGSSGDVDENGTAAGDVDGNGTAVVDDGKPSAAQAEEAGRAEEAFGAEEAFEAFGAEELEADWTKQAGVRAAPAARPADGLYKTRLCKNWKKSGSCLYAGSCNFAHCKEELRSASGAAAAAPPAYSLVPSPTPASRPSTRQQQPERASHYKTLMCKKHEQIGSCKFGDKCSFAHSKEEQRSSDGAASFNSIDRMLQRW